MEVRANRTKQLFRILAKPEALIFGVAIVQFISMLVYVIRYELEFPVPADHWSQVRVTQEAFLVLFASLMLLIGGTWKYVLAIVSSVWVVYQLGYLGLVAVSAAFGLPMFSVEVLRRWLSIAYMSQPQYILQIILSAIIVTYAAFLLSRRSSGGLK